MTIQELFAKRGTKAKVRKLLGVNAATVTKWKYIPDRHLRAVSLALGVPQRDLPRKPEDDA